MRDVLITLMVFGTLPYIFRYPWYGVLVWSWLSYMNPHRLAWGFAYDMPFAQIVAIVLLISLVISPERKKLPNNPLVIWWIVFLVWLSISSVNAVYPDLAYPTLQKILKIQLMTFVTIMLMLTLQRVNQLIWVIVFSIGYYSVKGGVFTFITGGAFHVFGPDGTDIQENNALAVGVLMIIPLMIYMNKFPPKPWVKLIMPYCIFFSLASVIGSQSRGAVLAIVAVGVFYWWKTKNKFFTAIVFLALALLTYSFMPTEWHDRVASIATYTEDSSSMSRIRAWEYSIAIANDRLTGGGFMSWSLMNYNKYGIYAEQAFVAHSIYFSVLNDGGWPGLGIFLTILLLIWRQLRRVIVVTDNDPAYVEHNFLARMLQISIVAFMAGGTFLSLSYFDLAWHLMSITIALTQLTQGVSRKEGVKKGARRQPAMAGAYRPRGRLSGKS
jgi:putative inorganic carbon (HCO3(-)) transporter